MTETTATNETTTAAETTTAETAEQTQNTPLTTEAIEKLIQSRVDKASAEYGKKIANLQKENENLKKQNLSAEEIRNLEISEKEKALLERERELKDRENRLYAIKAIKENGLDDGSDKSLSLIDFVMAEDEKTIDERVKAFNDLVNKFVSAKVDEKFRAIGRVPNGAAGSNTESDKKENGVAVKLGQQRAEQEKKANDILNMYLGGKK